MTKMSVRCEGGRLANQNLNITQCIIQNQNLKISEGFFLNVLQILGARLFHIWLTLGPTRVRFMVGFSPVMAMCSAKSSCRRVFTVQRIDVPFQSLLWEVFEECKAGADFMLPKRSSACCSRCALSCSFYNGAIGLANITFRAVATLYVVDGIHRSGSSWRSGLGFC